MCFRPPNVSKPTRCACGTLNPPNAPKCRKCGTPLAAEIETFICPRCGTQTPVTETACKNCGLTAEEAAAYMNPDE
ncbi:double zinc ribbon protein [Desulfitobacterium sp. LBE]|uniref:double zinc ribbon domain-containing protein n=1 Tax=Desulfitobacterium sp. LBE TaxID=884086 RepID=UPI00119A4C0C|nr:zinc ribbon domain-containing protein [Desulfitobacterium sp. LBE]TWH57280.1 double zinc ribbon protein [Desulfitobacterium sp. LBE]